MKATLTENLEEEQRALTRRFIHYTRKSKSMSLEEAIALAKQMENKNVV